MWSTIGSVLYAIGQLFGIVNRRQDLNNSPEMQRAAQAKKDQEEKDRLNKLLEEENEEAIRRASS